MRNTLTIAQRELFSFFYSPIAYVVIALFVFIASSFFIARTFSPGQVAEMNKLFEALIWVLILIAPAISMRLISEELNTGTIESLATAPVSDAALILGKWLGALACYACTLLPTLAFCFYLELYANPDYGPIASGYLGLVLVGALYLAIGVFASALTQNQIIAFVTTVFIILVFTVFTYYMPGLIGSADTSLLAANISLSVAAPLIPITVTAVAVIARLATASNSFTATATIITLVALVALWALLAIPSAHTLARIASYLNINEHYYDFAKGVIDLSDIVFFVSAAGLFLAFAVVAMESRRWR